jgi:hypothetical protein
MFGPNFILMLLMFGGVINTMLTLYDLYILLIISISIYIDYIWYSLYLKSILYYIIVIAFPAVAMSILFCTEPGAGEGWEGSEMEAKGASSQDYPTHCKGKWYLSRKTMEHDDKPWNFRKNDDKPWNFRKS